MAFVGYHAGHSFHFVRLAATIIVVSAWMDDNLRTPHPEGSNINCALILLGDHSGGPLRSQKIKINIRRMIRNI
jgi:hypothetical protein